MSIIFAVLILSVRLFWLISCFGSLARECFSAPWRRVILSAMSRHACVLVHTSDYLPRSAQLTCISIRWMAGTPCACEDRTGTLKAKQVEGSGIDFNYLYLWTQWGDDVKLRRFFRDQWHQPFLGRTFLGCPPVRIPK
ncbi:hypothetical protein K438DRAFT_701329 [Mycena galopus ATCC 62051]|nr:hypothetical protein K438DRAFT_701329 [Mycena galopus ATCC 62051]